MAFFTNITCEALDKCVIIITKQRSVALLCEDNYCFSNYIANNHAICYYKDIDFIKHNQDTSFAIKSTQVKHACQWVNLEKRGKMTKPKSAKISAGDPRAKNIQKFHKSY